jgi:hypothetical protein
MLKIHLLRNARTKQFRWFNQYMKGNQHGLQRI